MKSSVVAALMAASILAAGCDLLSKKSDSSSETPTGPSTVKIDEFAGTWQSVAAATPATGCGNLKYTVTPTTATSANVSFTATCASNITVTGSGSGTLAADALNWSSSGLVSQGGVNCPFTFSNSKAALDASKQVVVTYSGTVCGIPVSGTETVKK
jgi:hypothetical protein